MRLLSVVWFGGRGIGGLVRASWLGWGVGMGCVGGDIGVGAEEF